MTPRTTTFGISCGTRLFFPKTTGGCSLHSRLRSTFFGDEIAVLAGWSTGVFKRELSSGGAEGAGEGVLGISDGEDDGDEPGDENSAGVSDGVDLSVTLVRRSSLMA